MNSTLTWRQSRTAEEWTALGVACPRCRSELRDLPKPADENAEGRDVSPASSSRGAQTSGRDAVLVCVQCGVQYPRIVGIPDLRTGEDPYLTRADDRAAAEKLASRADSLDFAALYASYYDGNEKVTPQQASQFTRGVLAAGARAEASLGVWRAMDSSVATRQGMIVDLGCGTAPLGIALADRGEDVIGLDVGLRWLVLARKRAAEQGIDLPVICANAESLPLRDGSVSQVVGESVLENLVSGAAALDECHRVLITGGSLWLTTANRHSLAPDPHLGVIAGGWWPESRLRAHAQAKGQVFPVRTLYTRAELTRSLSMANFTAVRCALPRFADAQVASLSQAARGIVAVYDVTRRLPVVRDIVLRVGPTLVCTATRP